MVRPLSGVAMVILAAALLLPLFALWFVVSLALAEALLPVPDPRPLCICPDPLELVPYALAGTFVSDLVIIAILKRRQTKRTRPGAPDAAGSKA